MNRYGVWGLGIVGLSVLKYLHKQGKQLSVLEKRTLTQEEQDFLDLHGVAQLGREDFFAQNEVIVPSPGVDTRSVSHNYLAELDLFAAAWKKPVIAITGTIGKTSCVTMLDQAFKKTHLRVATGGNIGKAMLDLVEGQDVSDYALLELSSFQLEKAKHFAADIAVITNIYPNHLDRHGDFSSYVAAKLNLLANQQSSARALVPIELAPMIKEFTQRPVSYFGPYDDPHISYQDSLYFIKDQGIWLRTQSQLKKIGQLPYQAPGFTQNYLIIAAIGHMLSLDLLCSDFEIPEHRLEKVATIDEVTYYNDSKSTVFEATQSAVDSLYPGKIHLLLGGVSKGVDRMRKIPLLANKVKSIICFGAEAQELYSACTQAGISSFAFETMEAALEKTKELSSSGDIILFSPAGASFDLFKDYQERGKAFKKIIRTYQENFK